MRGISWLYEELSASQEGLWSIKSVSSHRSIKSVSSHYLILFPSQYLVTQHQDGDSPLYVYVTTSLRQNYLSRNIHPKINSPFYEWSYFRRTFTSVTFRNNIHALSGCRTHDPGLRKTGGSTRLNICWYNDQQENTFTWTITFYGQGFEVRTQLLIFLFSRTSTPALGSTQFNGCQGSFPRLSGRSVKLTSRLHQVLWLRMGGAILLPLFDFMAWTATTLTFKSAITGLFDDAASVKSTAGW